MASDRFDLEQQITKCWFVVDDLKEFDEALFEGWIKTDPDAMSNYILGIANSYDVKFQKLWYLFETVCMDAFRKNKMLEEECAALREQLSDAYDGQGYGIAAIKPKKKDKK